VPTIIVRLFFMSDLSGRTVLAIAQAFVHAVADSGQLSRINAALIAFAAVHAAVSLALVHVAGAVGMIAACFNV